MPELPEVETVCRGLTPYLVGEKIATMTLRRANLRFVFPPDFAAKVEGASITSVQRRAKFILKHLDNGLVWLTHLGMTGRYTVLPQASQTPKASQVEEKTPHDHVRVLMGNGTVLVYTDPRRFGYMDLHAADDLENCRHLQHLGPEPLSNQFNAAVLEKAFAAKQVPIKNALLNQHIVAGLGNIYVCEALFRAGISPRRKCAQVGATKCARLVPHIRDILNEAIAAGGSTLRDFAGAQGNAGYFQHQFDVYGREDEACSNPHCSASIKRIVQSGRSSFFCPSCQK